MMSRAHLIERLKGSLSWLLISGQTIRWATEQVVLRDILKTSRAARPGSAADIGCGGGRYMLDLLLPLSQHTVGVEMNRDSLQIAARRITGLKCQSQAAVVCGSADSIPLQDESLDLVLCTQVLEHLPDVQQGVNEIYRILRSGGKAILSIPIPPDPYPNPEHLHKDFTPEVLERNLDLAGFTVVDRRECMYAVSRAIAWLLNATGLPLPLVPLCRWEQATARLIPWPSPHVYICVAAKA